ncbi:MAG TPA: hypothetical protein DDW65_23775 [Firmicutes bacterium]|nr:hypothetical protein [Bacillota bacterium]
MKPISVMIVDDEEIVIEDLISLISWNNYGFQIVAAATNGRKALDLFERFHPQVVITDIKMPGIDGLRLSESILGKGYSVKILLLTAYKDFEYARNAISMGVSNYLLKHEINEETFLKEMLKIKREIENQHIQRRLFRAQFFKKMLERGYEPEEVEERQEFIDVQNEKFIMLLLKVDTPFPVIDSVIINSSYSLSERLKIDLELAPEFVKDVDILDLSNNRSIMVISIESVYSQRQIIEELYSYARVIQGCLRQCSDKTLSIVVFNLVFNLNECHAFFEKATHFLEYGVFFEKEKICLEIPFQPKDVLMETNILEQLNLFKNALNNMDVDCIAQYLHQIFTKLVSHYKESIFLKKVCTDLVKMLDDFSNRYGLLSLTEYCTSHEDCRDSWLDIGELQEWFTVMAVERCNEAQNKAKFNISPKIRCVLKYIEEHYGEDLTVEKAAETLGLSRVYLGQLFKKEIGHTFLEYLTQYRIDVAKQMLLNGHYKIYEIAEKTGYSTSQYFSEVFRKVTGINPLDFRNGVTNHETKH